MAALLAAVSARRRVGQLAGEELEEKLLGQGRAEGGIQRGEEILRGVRELGVRRAKKVQEGSPASQRRLVGGKG